MCVPGGCIEPFTHTVHAGLRSHVLTTITLNSSKLRLFSAHVIQHVDDTLANTIQLLPASRTH